MIDGLDGLWTLDCPVSRGVEETRSRQIKGPVGRVFGNLGDLMSCFFGVYNGIEGCIGQV